MGAGGARRQLFFARFQRRPALPRRVVFSCFILLFGGLRADLRTLKALFGTHLEPIWGVVVSHLGLCCQLCPIWGCQLCPIWGFVWNPFGALLCPNWGFVVQIGLPAASALIGVRLINSGFCCVACLGHQARPTRSAPVHDSAIMH